jgi:tetratricopeptide (TPR) repeat protein
VNISLDSNPQRVLLLAFALAITMVFSYEGIRLALASHRIVSGDLPRIKNAVALEPGNAEYWDLMGRFLQFQLDEPNLSDAVASFAQATKLSPRTARYWMDLAISQEAMGQLDGARASFDHALAVYPASAQVHWEYGNFLLRQGQIEEALAQLRGAVASDPELTYIAITRVWRATKDPSRVISVVPRTADAYIQVVDFFADIHNLTPGLSAWSQLIALKQPLEISQTFQFFDELIREGRSSDAERAWPQALAACDLPHDPPPNGSAVWNGGFEQEIVNGGLDWRIQPLAGMALDYDDSIFHSGARSLRLDFEGGVNLDLSAPMEMVPVQPNRSYHFQGFMRTENITTESGLRFYVVDPQRQGAVLLTSDSLTGTHPWTELSGDVHTSPMTNFLVVQVRRVPSRLFENKLGGSAWIDDVSLVPVSPEAAGSSSSGTSSNLATPASKGAQ